MTDSYREYRTAVANEYKKVKVGNRNLNDVILDLDYYQKINIPGQKGFCKADIYKAIADHDLPELRRISNLFYSINGIYERTCNYFAFLYRYDWYVAPEILDDTVKEEKILKDFSKTLNYLDSSYIKKICGDISLKVIKEGCYYGYIVPSNDHLILQDLPVNFCRSRYSVDNMPVIEFNMKFFDTFRDINYRMKVLKLFPDEFAKGYMLYKQGKLKSEENILGRDSTIGCWYMLDPQYCVKFNLNNDDMPLFVSSIPAIMDLDAAQELDRKKQMQKLLKIIVQKLPMDKNGDLIFDSDEALDIHHNAVEMLRRCIGVDVLTTFTDVDTIDLADKNTTTTTDDLSKVERTVYNSLGISQNLFNTDGNMALEKSVLNDESYLRNLLLQYNIFFNRITAMRNSNSRKYNFKFYMLETTQYNYQNLAKLYKEHVQLGYSKMLPQIALGHSQSFILNAAHFENDVLHLSEVMIPPLMSSTMGSEDILGLKGSGNKPETQNNSGTQKTNITTTTAKTSSGSGTAGRPEKADDEKSSKTIQNKESMS